MKVKFDDQVHFKMMKNVREDAEKQLAMEGHSISDYLRTIMYEKAKLYQQNSKEVQKC